MVTQPTHAQSFTRRTFITLTCLVLSLSANSAFAQPPTTVQLPTLRQFSVSTSVLVPDGGSAYLGGVNSHRSGSASAGVPFMGNLPGLGRAFNNRAFSVNDSARQARVKATIIDLDEMDAAVLRTAAARQARKRMSGFAANDKLFNGKGAIQDGAANGGVGTLYKDEVTRRARFLSQNMGRSAGTMKRPSAKASSASSTKKADAKPKTPEPPLFLNKRR